MTVNLVSLKNVENKLRLKVRLWRNSPEVSRFFIMNEIPLKIHKDWLKKNIDMGLDRAFVIFFEESPVGLVYLRKIDKKNKTAEYGIFLKPNAPKNMGIGYKATVKILDYGFNILGLEKIYLEVLPFNKAAISLYEKIGFKTEAVLRRHIVKAGKRLDLIWMGMMADEWNVPVKIRKKIKSKK